MFPRLEEAEQFLRQKQMRRVRIYGRNGERREPDILGTDINSPGLCGRRYNWVQLAQGAATLAVITASAPARLGELASVKSSLETPSK